MAIEVKVLEAQTTHVVKEAVRTTAAIISQALKDKFGDNIAISTPTYQPDGKYSFYMVTLGSIIEPRFFSMSKSTKLVGRTQYTGTFCGYSEVITLTKVS